MILLLLLLLAHLLGDFILQSDEMAKDKDRFNKNRLKAVLKHAFIHSLLYGAIFLFMFYILHESYVNRILIVFIIALSHFVIDWGKPYLRYIGIKNKALIFSIDQGIHLAIIFLIINKIIKAPILSVLKGMKSANYFETATFLLIIWILLTTFSNIFIRCFLEPIKQTKTNNNNVKENDDVAKKGRYIGALERILAFLAVYTNSPTVLIGIFATKTAIRFKQFEEKEFAEYYFIGTSLSALMAIAIALFCRWLLT